MAGAVAVALRDRCEHLQAVMLNRRIKRELAHSTASQAPEALWAASLPPDEAASAGKNARSGRPARQAIASAAKRSQVQWIKELDRRRTELAQSAEHRLEVLPLSARVTASERIVQASLDETGETTAFLEDMSLRRAVDRLDLLGDDLALLAELVPGLARALPP